MAMVPGTRGAARGRGHKCEDLLRPTPPGSCLTAREDACERGRNWGQSEPVAVSAQMGETQRPCPSHQTHTLAILWERQSQDVSSALLGTTQA